MSRSQAPSASDRWDRHLLHLYSSPSERETTLAAWVADGLERDEQVIFSQPDGTEPESTLCMLRSHGVDAADAVADGQLVLLAVPDFYAAQHDLVCTSLAEGYPAVRLTGDSAAALGHVSADAYVEIERALEAMCADGRVRSLCQYPRAGTEGGWLDQATENHPGGVLERQLGVMGTTHRHGVDGATGGLMLAGAVDVDNDKVLAAVLRAAALRTGETPDAGTLTLDLSDLTFVSVSGARALVDATAPCRERGGTVELLELSPVVSRLLRLLDIDQLFCIRSMGVAS